MILAFVIYVLWRALWKEKEARENENKAWEKKFDDLRERLFKYGNDTLLAVERSTTATNLNTAAGESRAAAIDKMGSSIATIVAAMEANRTHFGSGMVRMEESDKEVREQLHEIVRLLERSRRE